MHYVKGFIERTVGTIKAKLSFEGIAVVIDHGECYEIGGIAIPKSQITLLHPVKASKSTLDLSKYELTMYKAPAKAHQSDSDASEIIAKRLARIEVAMREMRRARAIIDVDGIKHQFDEKSAFFKAVYEHALRNKETSLARQHARHFVEVTNSMMLDIYEAKTAAALRKELQAGFRT